MELTKIRISLFTTLSASTGFILAGQGISKEILLPALGVFFLASGSCALNQYQERRHDQRMERTRGRPLPSKKLSSPTALNISIGLLLWGSILLYAGAHGAALGFGLFAVFWYNGVYTLLKRKSAFAAIPGALIGAIPPMIGWVAGKGRLCLDPQILAISFFFFIWQIPHFWLLLLYSGKDYEKAGLPSLTKLFSSGQLRRITFVWIFASSTVCMMLPLFGTVESHAIHGGLFLIAFWVVWNNLRFLAPHRHLSFPTSPFKTTNAYAIGVVVLIAMDRLFH